jgi:hypothetical protein
VGGGARLCQVLVVRGLQLQGSSEEAEALTGAQVLVRVGQEERQGLWLVFLAGWHIVVRGAWAAEVGSMLTKRRNCHTSMQHYKLSYLTPAAWCDVQLQPAHPLQLPSARLA